MTGSYCNVYDVFQNVPLFFSWTPCHCSLEKWKATIGQGRGLVKWLSSCWTSKVWQRAADHPSNHCRLNHASEQPFQVPSFENSLTQQTFFKQLSFANDQWRPKGLQEAVLRDNPFFFSHVLQCFQKWTIQIFWSCLMFLFDCSSEWHLLWLHKNQRPPIWSFQYLQCIPKLGKPP